MLHDDARGEDVTQEAFLSGLRRIRETDGELAFRPWIYRIAQNAAIDSHRRSSRVWRSRWTPRPGFPGPISAA